MATRMRTFRRRHLMLKQPPRVLIRMVIYLLALLLSACFMGPFIWTVSSSLKHYSELQVFPPRLWPEVPQWSNYPRIMAMVPYGRWMWNSILVTFLGVSGTIISCSLVAYSFARFRYPGRDMLFLLVLSTMMLPEEVTLIPTYLLFHYVRWLDSFRPLIVPAWLGGSAFGIFLLRQFFLTLPMDLDEAARLDGASHFRIFWNILLPLSGPALATLAVISFVGTWDSFMQPLIFLNSPSKFTLAIGLRYFQGVPDILAQPTEHLLMGAATMMAAPPIVLFFLAQRYFVRGIVMSGIKG